MQRKTLIAIVLVSLSLSIHIAAAATATASASADYGAALKKALLYFEAQRSGKLPGNRRVQWRGDSALRDGQNVKIDLVGGYYDAGDNLKLGLPLAFTITMLSWSTIEFRDKLSAKSELSNALGAIRWGTDYLMKAHTQPNVLYGQVGETDSDHQCWQRPEDMTTPRTAFKIDDQHPGSDLAAETAAALAAASVAFQPVDGKYASQLLPHAKNLFEFARNRPGLYSDSIPDAKKIYSSSGYDDEMLWAAAWLHIATNDKSYLNYIESKSGNTGGFRTTFSWDDKYVGAQILVAKLIFERKISGAEGWAAGFKKQAEDFICSCAQRHSNNVKKTPGGLLWFLPWNNVQYVATASFATVVYSKYLSQKKTSLQCNAGIVNPSELLNIARAQVDYILGSNPKKMSYMVGYGSSYPQKVHHRAASIVSIKKDPSPVSCKGGFDKWFNSNAPNPNVLEGAVVSADANDNYDDSRSNFKVAEPTTVTNAPLVGVLAYLA